MTLKRPYPESYQAVPCRSPRVATLPDGSLLVLSEPGFTEFGRAVLHHVPALPAQEGLHGAGLALIATHRSVFHCGTAAPLQAGIWVDAGGRIWVAWSDGDRIGVRRTCEPFRDLAGLRAAGAWERYDMKLPHGTALWHLGSAVLDPQQPGNILLALLEQPAGRIHVVAAGESGAVRSVLHTHPRNHAPSIAVDPAGGRVHVVWATEDLYIRYRAVDRVDLAAGRVREEEPFEVWRYSHHPDVASNGREVIVTYTDHMHNIKYGWFDGRAWHQDLHLTTLHPRFLETLQHSPWLWRDRQGAVHLSFACLTRDLVFDSQWLGEDFSDPQPVEGLFHPSLFVDEVRVRPERMSLERDGGTLLLSSSFLPERHGVYQQEQEAIALSPDEPVLMFETGAFAEWRNLQSRLETMRPDPVEPVLLPTGRVEDFDGSRVLSGGTVLHDGGRFRMWYGALALKAQPGVQWYDQVYVGYAESADSCNWSRVDTGNGAEFLGRPAPNRILNVDHNACVFIDPLDEPERRYKAVKFDSRAQCHDRIVATGAATGYLGLPRCGWLSTSADGLTWRREAITIDFPGAEPYSLQPQGAIYDPADPDPQRRYKVLGFTSQVGHRRCATLACSADCRHWTVAERSPLLDSMMAVTPVRPAGSFAQLHDATIARWGRYLLGFYQNQFDSESADIRLAFSRFGDRFRFAFPETPLVALGPAGSWNSRYLMPSSLVAVGDRVYLYYGAFSDQPYVTEHGLPIARMCGGRVSTLRDRWVALSPRENGDALLETKSWSLPSGAEPLRLELNARLQPGAKVTVALLPVDRPESEWPGYEMAACQPLCGDQVRHRVTWQSQMYLPPGPCRFRLRLKLTGGSPADAIYSFTLRRSE